MQEEGGGGGTKYNFFGIYKPLIWEQPDEYFTTTLWLLR